MVRILSLAIRPRIFSPKNSCPILIATVFLSTDALGSEKISVSWRATKVAESKWIDPERTVVMRNRVRNEQHITDSAVVVFWTGLLEKMFPRNR